jgi:hypothetical protein
MAEGWLTIGTRLSTDKFDKQLRSFEDKVKKEEQKVQLKLKAKLQAERELQQHKQDILEIEKVYEELSQKVEHVQEIMTRQAKGMALSPQDFTDLQNFEQLNSKYEKVGKQLDRMYNKQGQLNMKVERTSLAYQEATDRVSQYKQKIEEINLQRHQEDINKFKEEFNGVGNSIQSVISKVSKLALGIFSIRTAFSFVKRASSDLANYNPQYAANLEYIRYALTQMIAPALEYILNLAKTILAYINYIVNAWFGKNLFDNASAKSFNQLKKNIAGATKQAKELQKTLAGFDEMNILNSNSTGGGGGVGGALGPDFDLSDLEAVEIPDWVKWIAENKDIVIGAIMGIIGALLLFKTMKIIDTLTGVTNGFNFFKKTLLSLGISAIIIGIVIAIKGIIDYMKNPTWENFRTILLGLEIAIAGVAAVMLALNKSNPLGWVILAIDAVALLVTWLTDVTQVETEEERKTRQLKKAEDELREAREKLTDATSDYIDAVEGAENAEQKLKEAQDKTGISIDELLRKMDDEGLTYKDLNEQQREVYKAYINNKNAQDKLKDSTNKLKEAQDLEEEKLFMLVGAYKGNSDSLEDYKNNLINAYNEGKISAEDATRAMSVALANLDEDTRRKFTESLPDAIRQGLDPNKYQDIANRFVRFWEEKIGKIENRLDTGVTDSMRRLLSKMTNFKVNVEGTSYGDRVGGYVTKMASGGLVNMPNRGVPLSNVRAGESGTEGIIPLTDQQAMAQLGAEIGRNVLVNLTNITSMNGRVISRELKTIQSEEDFAFNT